MNPLGWPLLAGGALVAQTPQPTPTDPAFTIYTVTPGISGFLAFFALAVACWLLFRSMGRRMRNVDQERRRRETQAAEAAARPGGGPVRTGSGPVPAEDGPPPATDDDAHLVTGNGPQDDTPGDPPR